VYAFRNVDSCDGQPNESAAISGNASLAISIVLPRWRRATEGRAAKGEFARRFSLFTIVSDESSQSEGREKNESREQRREEAPSISARFAPSSTTDPRRVFDADSSRVIRRDDFVDLE